MAPVTPRVWPWILSLAVGVGLVLAPTIFSMYSRAPGGGEMIDAFRPYMNEPTITRFQRDLRSIGDAVDESRDRLDPRLTAMGITDDRIRAQFPAYTAFKEQWPAISRDMGGMLRTMHADIDDYRAVDDLPPFFLFPWFFAIPGVAIAAGSAWGLVRARGGRSVLGPVILLAYLGGGLILAPAVFSMFTATPKGGDMISDFRPLMTTARVQRIQGYFLVLGAGEGSLRAQVLPALVPRDDASEPVALPAIARFSEAWPRISNQMAPMVGVMSDNVANFRGIAALPPFPLFPWFFVAPGILVVAAAIAARPNRLFHERAAGTTGAPAHDRVPTRSTA